MRQLVVLVGLPGAGKTAYHEKELGWAVISKDVIRQSMFGHSYNAEFEDAVDRIFSTAVVEAAESSAEVVCIDDLNLLRRDRQTYVELGTLSGRETIAVVLPYDPVDALYRNVQSQLAALAARTPHIKVAAFPRDRFDAMLRCYEAVVLDEGFAQIRREERLVETGMPSGAEVVPLRSRRRREEKQDPIPLFAA